MLFFMFLSSSSLELFILSYCEKNYLLKKNKKSIILLKKLFENTIFTVILVIFKQY